MVFQETSQKLLSVEEDQQKVEGERRQLQQALEMVQENADRQVRELEQENTQLTNTIEVLLKVLMNLVQLWFVCYLS